MSRVAQYLQEHIDGEIMSDKKSKKYFSTDASVFEAEPEFVIYPRSTSDVRKINRFSWQLAEKGKILPITARGKGTDLSGAAVGDGVVLVFPAHMNKLMELDTAKGTIVVQPGLNYLNLQHTLHSHNRFLPPFPSSIDYATLGGAIANNTAGEKTVKYGSTVNYVKELSVVLANGELMETKRLSKKELSHKKGMTSLEGEIYRAVDNLIEDNKEVINNFTSKVSKNTAGYNIFAVKNKDGSFDLTPLIVGSQGTLGVITKAKLSTEPYNPNPTLMVAQFDDIHHASSAVEKLLPLKPSAVEMVDVNLLKFIEKHNPHQLKGLIKNPLPAIILLIEFDDTSTRAIRKKIKGATKILKPTAQDLKITNDEREREGLWKIRHSAAAVIWHTQNSSKAVPIIEDGVVPQDQLANFVKEIYKMFKKQNTDVAIWGHAGDGNIHMQPFLDLGKVGDRQKAFKIMDEYYQLAMKMGGSTSGEHNDGRLRGPYLKELYGNELYEIFVSVKKIFDPYNILNPGVKIGVSREDVVPMMRHEYSVEHLADHMPRT